VGACAQFCDQLVSGNGKRCPFWRHLHLIALSFYLLTPVEFKTGYRHWVPGS